MPRRPDEEGPEPEGGGPADRLRQHLDARYGEEDRPASPLDDLAEEEIPAEEADASSAEDDDGEPPDDADELPDEPDDGGAWGEVEIEDAD